MALLLKIWHAQPRWIHHGWAFLFLHLWWLCKPKHKKRILERLQKLPMQVNPKKVYRNLYWNIHASFAVFFKKAPLPALEIQDPTQWQKALESRNQLVLFSIHQGAFELLHPVIAQNTNRSVLVPVRSAHPLLNKLRSQFGSQLFLPKEQKELLRALQKEPSILTLLIDQSPKDIEIQEELLGAPCPLWPELCLKLAKEGALLFPFYITREGPHQKVVIEKPLLTDSEEERIQLIFQRVDSWIQERPEEWVWHYPKHWN